MSGKCSGELGCVPSLGDPATAGPSTAVRLQR